MLILCVLTGMSGLSEGAATRLGSIQGLELPTRVAVDNAGSIYVTDSMMNRLSIFNRDGSKRHVLYGLNWPLGVAVDSAGRIYIGNMNYSGTSKRAGSAGASVDVYSPSYQYLFSLGKGKGEFKLPNSIKIHSNGSIYVTDSDAHMVKIYNPDGSPQGTFGVWGSNTGSKNGEFNFPAGMAIDEAAGEVYVTDLAIFVDPTNGITGGARVQVFDLSGGFIRSFGTFGTGDGKLFKPLGIAYNEGRVYITDSLQSVVQVFDTVGNYIETIFDLNQPMGTPIGIVIGGDNRIFIASSGTKTVEIFGEGNYTYLTVSPATLDFSTQEGVNPVTQDITIGNSGTGTLDWSMTADAGWITLGQAIGTVNGNGASAVPVGINASGLTQGTYTGVVTVAADGASEKVQVNLTVLPPPVLEVTPSSLSFRGQANGSQPAGQGVSINITNDASGTAAWTAAGSAGWLGMTPSAGSSAALTAASVSVNTTGLGAGVYNGIITISSAGAAGSPANVAVTLELIAAGNIAVTTNIAEANFSISGPASYSGSGEDWSMTDAPAGQYSITFNKVIGFKTPASQTFTVETGKTSSISGTYKDLRASKKVIAGMGEGMANVAGVKVLNTDGTSAGSAFIAFAYKYGASVAAGDIDGDGIDEIIAGAGSAIWNPARVTVFRADGTAIPGLDFVAFQSNNGVNVAAGDVDGDGAAEIIVGTEPGKGISANVRVFKVVSGAIEDTGINFITDPARNGVYVAAGDLDGDGVAEIITGTTLFGTSGDAVVRTWAADTSKGLGSWAVKSVNTFKPYGRDRGAVVAAGDINGDGTDEILVAEAVSKNAKIRAYKGDGTFAGLEIIERNLQGPLSMASGDTDSDGQAEIVIGAGPSWLNPAAVRIYSGTGTFLQGFTAFSERGGVNVGLGKVE